MNSLNEIQAENLKVNVTAIRLLVAKMELNVGEKWKSCEYIKRVKEISLDCIVQFVLGYTTGKNCFPRTFFFILFNDFGTCLLWSYPAGNTSQPINCFLAVRKRRGHRLFDTRSF